MLILILDDHPLFADALRQIVLRLGNGISVDVSTTVETALTHIDTGRSYDLILVDIGLPGLDGFGFMRLLQDRFVPSPVIVISAAQDLSHQQRAMSLGAMGFVYKSANARTFLQAISTVLTGDPWFDPRYASESICFSNRKAASAPKPKSLGLSERQFKILQLMENGLSNKAIGRELGISESTVKTHVSRLISALAVHNRTACVTEAQRLGLL